MANIARNEDIKPMGPSMQRIEVAGSSFRRIVKTKLAIPQSTIT
jgi:hypothetical protein